MLRVRGDAVQVWQRGAQVGNLYRYTLVQSGETWMADAGKYRLEPGYEREECEFRFFVESEGRVELEIRTLGELDACTVDGTVHKEPVHAEGSRVWIPTGEPQPSA